MQALRAVHWWISMQEQGLRFRKRKNFGPSEKQEIFEISEILDQNQIDLIFFKTKNI
jgi:hypothetical protein